MTDRVESIRKAVENEPWDHDTMTRDDARYLLSYIDLLEAVAEAAKACIRGSGDTTNGFRVNFQMADYEALRSALSALNEGGK